MHADPGCVYACMQAASSSGRTAAAQAVDQVVHDAETQADSKPVLAEQPMLAAPLLPEKNLGVLRGGR